MAGDWIKMRSSLCTHPKVLLIADIIAESTEIGRRLSTGFNGALREIVTRDVTRDIALSSLMRVWCATNEHTTDGVWISSTLDTLDMAAGIPGFGEAMEAAGWAIYDPENQTVTLPNFLENNAPAKNNARSSGAERQARHRQKKKALLVASRNSDGDVTRNVTVTSQSDAREEREKRVTREDSARISASTEEARAQGQTRVVRDEVEDDVPAPSPAGLACKAMRAAGLDQVNPGDPRLLELLKQGATIEEFAGIAAEAVTKQKGFAWVMVVLQNRRAEAAAIKLAAEVTTHVNGEVEATQAYLQSLDEHRKEASAEEKAAIAEKLRAARTLITSKPLNGPPPAALPPP